MAQLVGGEQSRNPESLSEGLLQNQGSPKPRYFVCCDGGRVNFIAAARATGTRRGESALGAGQAPGMRMGAGPERGCTGGGGTSRCGGPRKVHAHS